MEACNKQRNKCVNPSVDIANIEHTNVEFINDEDKHINNQEETSSHSSESRQAI